MPYSGCHHSCVSPSWVTDGEKIKTVLWSDSGSVMFFLQPGLSCDAGVGGGSVFWKYYLFRGLSYRTEGSRWAQKVLVLDWAPGNYHPELLGAQCTGDAALPESCGKHSAWAHLRVAKPRPIRWSPIWAGLLPRLFPCLFLKVSFP